MGENKLATHPSLSHLPQKSVHLPFPKWGLLLLSISMCSSLQMPILAPRRRERAPQVVLLKKMLPASSAAKIFPTSSDVAVVTDVTTGFFLVYYLRPLLDSDQLPPILRNQAKPQHHLTTGSSLVTRGLATSGLPFKKIFLKDNQGTFFFWGGKRSMGKGEKKKQERKINLQSSGTS